MHYLKLLFVLVTVLVVVNSKLTEKTRVIHDDCVKATEVDDEMFVKAHAREFVEDDKFKQYLLCFAKRVNFINDDGEMNSDGLKEFFSERIDDTAIVDEIVTKCSVKHETPEESAFKLAICVFEVAPEDYKFDVSE